MELAHLVVSWSYSHALDYSKESMLMVISSSSSGTLVLVSDTCFHHFSIHHMSFNAATSIMLQNGEKDLFWYSIWLDGKWPKDLAPLIFTISERKNRNVQSTLANKTWIRNINISAITSRQHIAQFVALWDRLSTQYISPRTELHGN